MKPLAMICAICLAHAAYGQVRYQITRIPVAQGANSVALGINKTGMLSATVFKERIIKRSFIPLRINR
jgi:hypothetical protein